MGLNRNYSKLKDDINKANNLIQDPEKNSTSFITLPHAQPKVSHLVHLRVFGPTRDLVHHLKERCYVLTGPVCWNEMNKLEYHIDSL